MKEIKINFTDFWPDLNKTNNYFYNLLAEHYTVVIDENPDLIFYSCFGSEYLNYKCKRIYYTGENIRPDFTACDFAFSFDFNANKNHLRLPLYFLYMDESFLEVTKSKEELVQIWNSKTKFCCMVVSNPKSKKRLDFFKKLSQFKTVDSGGKVLNNVGGRVQDKMAFIKEYRFVISFENESHDGYTTEKILQPIMVDSIPIYWGNKKVDKDFNTKRFINHSDFKTEKELINRLLEIEKDPNLAIEMLLQPIFSKEKKSFSEERQEIFNAIDMVLKSKNNPKATTYFEKIHFLKCKFKRVKIALSRWVQETFIPHFFLSKVHS
jgi:alpha(1,3/1,4) fucosyltransferase